jgi:hypothetical protein
MHGHQNAQKRALARSHPLDGNVVSCCYAQGPAYTIIDSAHPSALLAVNALGEAALDQWVFLAGKDQVKAMAYSPLASAVPWVG